MAVTADAVADATLQQFDKLPQRRKPQDRGNGSWEWVPLSGIVAQVDENALRCIALGTGMKCLPASKVPDAHGLVLHDRHAEILAIRALNIFLLEECKALALTQVRSSAYLRRRQKDEITEQHFQPFTVKEDVKLHMYCSEAPCGDASMELTMAAQGDAAPWAVPPPLEIVPDSFSASPSPNPPTPLLGRAYFSALGIVRRKPSRPDAPTTLSKSCSDKLSLKQCTSLLSSTASLLISPENAYLHTLVLPQSQYSAKGCERAFGDGIGNDGSKTTGRMKHIKGMHWEETGYRFEPFRILTTDQEFAFSRRRGSPPGQKLVPSSLSTVWTATPPSASASSGIEESLIGGVLQGRRAFPPSPSPPQGLDLRGISNLSRKKTWRLAATISIALLSSPPSLSHPAGPAAQAPSPNFGLEPAIAIAIARALGVPREAVTRVYLYREVKECELLRGRRHVKEAIRETCLTGWVRNDSRGEEFTLDS